MYYTPKIFDAILTSLLSVFLMLMGARLGGKYQWGLYIGAAVLIIMTFVILYKLVIQDWDNYNQTIVELAKAYSNLDEEGRAALALAFPKLRYRMKHGEVRAMFEDTNVSIELFRLFLSDSNSKQIAPERDWNTSERPRWAWLEIFDWLDGDNEFKVKYIISDSAAGSHSWLWNGNSYNHLVAYWMAGRRIPNLSEPIPLRDYASPTG